MRRKTVKRTIGGTTESIKKKMEKMAGRQHVTGVNRRRTKLGYKGKYAQMIPLAKPIPLATLTPLAKPIPLATLTPLANSSLDRKMDRIIEKKIEAEEVFDKLGQIDRIKYKSQSPTNKHRNIVEKSFGGGRHKRTRSKKTRKY